MELTFYNDFIYLFTNNIQKIDLYNLFVDRESPIINLTNLNILMKILIKEY